MNWLKRLARRRLRLFTHTAASFVVYRYRYLAAFALFGFLSIILEIVLVSYAMPAAWDDLPKATLAFGAGLLVSFCLNAFFNFRVPRRYLLGSFARFALVSLLSFSLNMAAVRGLNEQFGLTYGPTRLICSGCLFLLAYMLHRRWTFARARNFGIAIYASAAERVYRVFHKIGRNCDHVHVDLVDATMNPEAAAVDLGRLRLARRLWAGTPLALHVMSLRPAAWAAQTWPWVDWYLFHLGGHDDLLGLIAECRLRRKKVGVVWHVTDRPSELLPYLPHVDFVMVLGIAQPGRSGQPLAEAAVAMAEMLDRLRGRYGYEVMFDGSVNARTVGRIPATYVVAASAVLGAAVPVMAVNCLKTGARYERRVA